MNGNLNGRKHLFIQAAMVKASPLLEGAMQMIRNILKSY